MQFFITSLDLIWSIQLRSSCTFRDLMQFPYVHVTSVLHLRNKITCKSRSNFSLRFYKELQYTVVKDENIILSQIFVIIFPMDTNSRYSLATHAYNKTCVKINYNICSISRGINSLFIFLFEGKK